MAQPIWNEHYATGHIPWDSEDPDPHLVAFVAAGRVAPGRALDIGAGTGTNAIWLAERGHDVLGVDLAPLAVEAARARLAGRPLACRFATRDFLAGPLDEAPFAFAFDRGCFHVFDEPDERAAFAASVAAALAPGGTWLSLIGSTEGPAREVGPPRRSARDIALAIEPSLELVELTAADFEGGPAPARAWVCVARRRTVPAQPSTRHG